MTVEETTEVPEFQSFRQVYLEFIFVLANTTDSVSICQR